MTYSQPLENEQMDEQSGQLAASSGMRRERRDVIANRQLVLDAAQRLFSARGIGNVTMEDIAQEAGVGKGTLYRRYAHKGLLCLTLLNEYVGQLQCAVEQQFATEQIVEAQGAGKPPKVHIARLLWFLDQLIAFNEQHAELLQAVHEEESEGRRFSMYHCPLYSWEYQVISELLRDAILAGECAMRREEIAEIEYLADALLAQLDIDLYRFQREVRGYSQQRIRDGLSYLLECIEVAHVVRRQQAEGDL